MGPPRDAGEKSAINNFNGLQVERVGFQFPFLRQPPDTTRSPLVRSAEISRCFRGL